jgi:hypothetical protein
MFTTLIKRQIAACESYIRNFEDGLPYADGPAFCQDKQRIRELREEARQWREILRLVTEATA